MIPLRIEGATTRIAGKESLTSRGDRILGIDVVVLDGVYVTRWEPTPDELAVLNAGGSVELQVLGHQPPVALTVAPHAGDD